METRKILRNVDTKNKVFQLIPSKNCYLYVAPIVLPLFFTNFIGLLNYRINFPFLFLSIFISGIVIFLNADIRFGENGADLIRDLLESQIIIHYERFNK